jgi:hypothetical protein
LQVFETVGGLVDLADCDPRQPLGRRGAGDGVRRDIVEDDRGSGGSGEAIVQLFGLDAPVERRHADAGELACPMQARHLEPVLQDDSETVAAPKAERGQPAGDARDLLIPGRIAEPPRAVDDRSHVGAALDRRKKGPTQIKHRKSIIRRAAPRQANDFVCRLLSGGSRCERAARAQWA